MATPPPMASPLSPPSRQSSLQGDNLQQQDVATRLHQMEVRQRHGVYPLEILPDGVIVTPPPPLAWSDPAVMVLLGCVVVCADIGREASCDVELPPRGAAALLLHVPGRLRVRVCAAGQAAGHSRPRGRGNQHTHTPLTHLPTPWGPCICCRCIRDSLSVSLCVYQVPRGRSVVWLHLGLSLRKLLHKYTATAQTPQPLLNNGPLSLLRDVAQLLEVRTPTTNKCRHSLLPTIYHIDVLPSSCDRPLRPALTPPSSSSLLVSRSWTITTVVRRPCSQSSCC
jgi:hypothetical protein